MKPDLLILAAGIGSRYGGLKQLDPVGPSGETILDYSIFDAVRAGFGRVVFVIRREMEEAFRERIGSKPVALDFAFQEMTNLPPPFKMPADRAKPWGTAHAILSAADKLNGPFAVINADDFYGAEAFRALARHLSGDGKTDSCMVGFILRQTLSPHGSVSRGLCQTNDDGFLTGTSEHTDIRETGGVISGINPLGEKIELTGNEIVSMNCWGFMPGFLEQAQTLFAEFLQSHIANPKAEFGIPAAVTGTIRSGAARVKVLHSSSTWFGVTYREDRPFVQAQIRTLTDRGIYPEKLWA